MCCPLSLPAQKVRAGSFWWGQTKPSANTLGPDLDPFLLSLFQCPPGHPFSSSVSSQFFSLSLLPPAIFYCPSLHFFCSAVPWNHAAAASSHSCVCKVWAPCLGASVGGEKEWREGASRRESSQPGSSKPGFDTRIFMQTVPLCFSSPQSINPDAFKGSFWEWEKAMFVWASAWWVLSLGGETYGPTQTRFRALPLLSPQDCDVLVLAAF